MTDRPGWISLADAVNRYGVAYNSLRKLVAADVFTRGKFSMAELRPPIYLRVEELDAWKAGGVLAVAPVKAAYEAAQKSLSAAGV